MRTKACGVAAQKLQHISIREDLIYMSASSKKKLRKEQNAQKQTEKQKDALYRAIRATKAQKADCEHQWSVQKNRLSKYKDKLNRMKFAYDRARSELSAYVAAAKKFEGNSMSQAQDNASAVDQCIRYIEEYTNTSL